MVKASIPETYKFKTYLGFTLEIKSKKLQYGCLQHYVALQKALVLLLQKLLLLQYFSQLPTIKQLL